MKEEGQAAITWRSAPVSQRPLPRLAAPGPGTGGRAAAHLRAQHDGALPFQEPLLPFAVARDPEPVHLQPGLETKPDQTRVLPKTSPGGHTHARLETMSKTL